VWPNEWVSVGAASRQSKQAATIVGQAGPAEG
jgi:hypothetical protein